MLKGFTNYDRWMLLLFFFNVFVSSTTAETWGGAWAIIGFQVAAFFVIFWVGISLVNRLNRKANARVRIEDLVVSGVLPVMRVTADAVVSRIMSEKTVKLFRSICPTFDEETLTVSRASADVFIDFMRKEYARHLADKVSVDSIAEDFLSETYTNVFEVTERTEHCRELVVCVAGWLQNTDKLHYFDGRFVSCLDTHTLKCYLKCLHEDGHI